MIVYKLLVIIPFCISIVSCSVSNDELKGGCWKYDSGQHIGDILDFKKLTVLNDTIYRQKEKIGVIIDREESIFGITNRKIFIRPLIESSDPFEQNFIKIKEKFPSSHEEYINPYPKDLGVYHQK